MTSKKNGFLTFIFSCMPGAGEMYMGFMKQGISIMTLFFAIIALGGFFNMGEVLFLMPIVWCYSFFHVHNINALPEEEFYCLEDKFLFNINDQEIKNFTRKFRPAIAVVLILIGINLIWSNFTGLIEVFIPAEYMHLWFEVTHTITNTLPRFILGILIIGVGIYLIKGKKKELDEVYIELEDRDRGGSQS